MSDNVKTLLVAQICADGGVQSRVELDQFTIDAYAQSMAEEAVFPPVTVFHDGTVYWLADGFHRLEATKQIKKEHIKADVRQGDRRNAILYSIGANTRHGLAPNNADKRRAVEIVLADEAWREWSDRIIAKRCGVSHPLVAKIRIECTPETDTSKQRTYRTKHGTVARMNTAKIGAGSKIDPAVRVTLEETNVADNREEVRRLASLQPEQQKQVAERLVLGSARTVKQAKRALDMDGLKEQVAQAPPPEGTYNVVVIDPPWPYQVRANDPTHRAANPYPSMSIDQLAELVIPAAPDCILWLWTTNSFLLEALTLLQQWDFEQKTMLTWVKDRMGLGDWLRGQTEHCLLAVRGNAKVLLTNQTTVLEGKMREHSRKPDEFYAMVEQLCPGTKAELFSRQERTGWTMFGAEPKRFSEEAA